MKIFLLSVSLTAFAATPYWVEPCTNSKTGCIASDVELAKWAMQAWAEASGGKLPFTLVEKREDALIRVVWATPEQGLYGETMPLDVHGHRGAQVNIRIVDPGGRDALLRDTIVYLTCLHESGHAIGLLHTRDFADIMYSFQFGGDIDEYFGRYRRRLKTREDIRKNSGISASDRAHLIELLR
ncbi:MAG: hypothetical protein LAO79_04230 [Acidobacteriia bacterium]|nr:hypothetical protein [Terriglobia bacterium]